MTQRDCDDCYYSKLEGEKEPCKSCKATDEGFTNWREVPLTNADRIRAMSDEELVNLHYSGSAHCIASDPTVCDRRDFIGNLTPCEQCYLKWLQQPAEEDDHA